VTPRPASLHSRAVPTTLITGGAGFIGSRVARSLQARGHDVVVVDNLHPQVHGGRGLPAELDGVGRFIPADVTVSATWPAILDVTAPDVIVHLAAETGTGQSLTESTRHAPVNVVGTAAMIDAVHASGRMPRRFVLASSRAVYGEGSWQTADGSIVYPAGRDRTDLERGIWDPRDAQGRALVPLASAADRTRPAPTNIYAATKLTQEHILDAWCAAHGVGLSTLRLQNVFGAGQSVTNSYTGVLTLFARTALQGGTIEVYEDGEILRDFVHVDDVVAAICRSVEREGSASDTLDIGSGVRTTILDAAELIATRAGAPRPKVSGRFRDGDVRAAQADIARSREILGYEPATSFATGIEDLLAWMPTTGLV
jgi:dTDP-L-rhamnose 4-epimerase